MALGSRISLPFLASMASRMASKSWCTDEMTSGASRPTSWRGGTGRFSRHGTRELASRASSRDIPRNRLTSARCKAAGWCGHASEASCEAVTI